MISNELDKMSFYFKLDIFCSYELWIHRMWDMSIRTFMASCDCRFLGDFLSLYFTLRTSERKSKVCKVFLDVYLVR